MKFQFCIVTDMLTGIVSTVVGDIHVLIEAMKKKTPVKTFSVLESRKKRNANTYDF